MYFEFENPDHPDFAFQRVSATADELKKHIGKQICYLTSYDIDRTRGYVFPRYMILSKVSGRKIFDEDRGLEIKISDLKEVGVKKDN